MMTFAIVLILGFLVYGLIRLRASKDESTLSVLHGALSALVDAVLAQFKLPDAKTS